MQRLIYLPLGGAGEIGMNMYVYGYGAPGREKLIIVDAGVTFSNMETTPGIDLIMPNMDWIKKRIDDIEGVFLTHAHEDHLGAIQYLFRFANLPLYASRLTARMAQHKLAEADISDPQIKCVEPGKLDEVSVGPFKVSFVPVSHSIPDSLALIIDTPKGRIIHTGDFKTDLGDKDVEDGQLFSSAWREAAKSEIIALVCDSTNIHVPRLGRPESNITPNLSEIINEAEGLIAATTFASNIARVRHLAQAGHKAGRSVVLLGRAMMRMVNMAIETGVLDGFPPLLEPREARHLPRNKLLLLTTGSQGEPRSATAQLSRGKFRGFTLEAGDTLLVSSKTIPGNELAVARVLNRLAAHGVRVIEDHDGLCHVSGHANRPDVTHLHQLMSPKLVVPMHGEDRHLVEHADLAQANGWNSVVVTNGSVLDITSGKICEEIDVVGCDYLDGKQVMPSSTRVIRDRLQLARQGSVSIAVSEGRHHDDLEVACKCVGLFSNAVKTLEDAVIETVYSKLKNDALRDQSNLAIVEQELTIAVRRLITEICGKRPIINILITTF